MPYTAARRARRAGSGIEPRSAKYARYARITTTSVMTFASWNAEYAPPNSARDHTRPVTSATTENTVPISAEATATASHRRGPVPGLAWSAAADARRCRVQSTMPLAPAVTANARYATH